MDISVSDNIYLKPIDHENAYSISLIDQLPNTELLKDEAGRLIYRCRLTDGDQK